MSITPSTIDNSSNISIQAPPAVPNKINIITQKDVNPDNITQPGKKKKLSRSFPTGAEPAQSSAVKAHQAARSRRRGFAWSVPARSGSLSVGTKEIRET